MNIALVRADEDYQCRGGRIRKGCKMSKLKSQFSATNWRRPTDCFGCRRDYSFFSMMMTMCCIRRSLLTQLDDRESPRGFGKDLAMLMDLSRSHRTHIFLHPPCVGKVMSHDRQANDDGFKKSHASDSALHSTIGLGRSWRS